MRRIIRWIIWHVGTVDINLVTDTPDIAEAVALYQRYHRQLLTVIDLDWKGFPAAEAIEDLSQLRAVARYHIEEAIRAANPNEVKSAVRAHVNRLTSTQPVKQSA